MTESLQRAIYHLLETEPFFAHFILNSRIIVDAKRVPTACASLVDLVPNFVFNPDFIESLSEEERVAVVKHEVLHVVLRHVYIKPKDAQDAWAWNLAMDCSINQFINNLPKGSITLDNLSKAIGQSLALFETSEYYYRHIRKNQDAINQAGLKPTDEHVEGSDAASSTLADGAVAKAIEEAVGKCRGNVPSVVLKVLDSLRKAQISWQQLLRNFVMSKAIQEKKNTYRRLDRRFDLPVPGRMRKRSLVLGVCADSSGSVSDEDYTKFLSEVQSISTCASMVYLVDADCEVREVQVIKRGKKLNPKRNGNGGTAYQPAITECTKRKCDAIIYFGDFDTADTPKDPGVPFLWVGVGNSPPPAKFGSVIRLN